MDPPDWIEAEGLQHRDRNPDTSHGLPLPLWRGLSEPVLETNLAELRIIVWNECALGQFRAKVTRTRIGHDFPRIVLRTEALTNELVEAESFGPGDFNRPV